MKLIPVCNTNGEVIRHTEPCLSAAFIRPERKSGFSFEVGNIDYTEIRRVETRTEDEEFLFSKMPRISEGKKYKEWSRRSNGWKTHRHTQYRSSFSRFFEPHRPLEW